jgi:hypothetical protein
VYLGTGPSARDLLYPSHPTPCEITPGRLILRHEEVVGKYAASSLAALSQGVQDGHHSFLYRTILPEAGQKGKAVRPANDVSVLVVDRDNDLLFTPLLWTVANGRASPNNVIVPIRDFQKGRRFHVLHAEIESIDLDRKEVQTGRSIDG